MKQTSLYVSTIPSSPAEDKLSLCLCVAVAGAYPSCFRAKAGYTLDKVASSWLGGGYKVLKSNDNYKCLRRDGWSFCGFTEWIITNCLLLKISSEPTTYFILHLSSSFNCARTVLKFQSKKKFLCFVTFSLEKCWRDAFWEILGQIITYNSLFSLILCCFLAQSVWKQT